MEDNINWVVEPTEKKFNLKDRDMKLLQIIISDYMFSLKDLGKKLNISKVAVHKKLKKLESMGVIKGYSCLINFGKLGFNTYQIGIKTNMTIEEKEKYISKLYKCDFINQILKLSGGKWDFLIRLISNEESFNENIDCIANPKINVMDILQVDKIIFKKEDENLKKANVTLKTKRELSKSEINLLFNLAKNSHQSISELSYKLKMSPRTILKKIKEFQKEKIIITFVTQINPFIYGNEGYLLIITTKNRKIEEKISNILPKKYSSGELLNFQNPNIISFHIVSNLNELSSIEKSIKPFINEINNYEFIKIEEQTQYNFFPKGVYNQLSNLTTQSQKSF